MKLNTCEMLDLAYRPVGVWFQDEKPEGAFEPDVTKRTCVVSLLLAAAKGRVVAVCDETCSCPGGAVGLGFGNAYERRKTLTHFMLANGVDEPGFPEGGELPPHMVNGERFFDCADTALRLMQNMQLRDADRRYVVFRPLDTWEGDDPQLVWLLANPDQISAFIMMCSYRNARVVNVVAPFGAGCQSIVLAKQQLDAEDPQAMMGMFDVSQRYRLPKDLLSLTFPFAMFKRLDDDMPYGCLTTHSWERLAGR